MLLFDWESGFVANGLSGGGIQCLGWGLWPVGKGLRGRGSTC